MPLSYTIDTELGIVRMTVEGSPSFQEQAEMTARFTRDPNYRAGMPILLDNRLRTEAAKTGHINKVAGHAERSSLLRPGTRCAVLVATDAEFGMTRMFGSLSEGKPLVTKPFREMSEAEQWLLSEE